MIGLILFGCATSLLLWSGITDLTQRRIPNTASVLLVAMWPIFLVLYGHMPWSGLLAFALTFAVGYLAWSFGYVGGGDVKLLSATALYAGMQDLGAALLITALLGGALALVMLSLQRFGPALAAAWQPRRIQASLCALPTQTIDLPYAVAIAGAGIWVMSRLMLA